MRVLGLDPASRSFGMCCGDGTEPPIAAAWQFAPVSTEDGADYGFLMSQVYQYLDATFRRFPDIGAVGYESPILINKASKGRPYRDSLAKLRLLYPLGPMVEWYCRDVAKVPYHEIGNAEAKREATGNSHAEKEDVALVAEKCGVVLPRLGRTDAGDAWAVWKCLLRAYNPEQWRRWDRLSFTPKGALL